MEYSYRHRGQWFRFIVCLGKPAFDMLSDIKIGFDGAHGGWFWSTEANCHLYLMHNPILLLSRPELHEMFRVDLREVERKLSISQDQRVLGCGLAVQNRRWFVCRIAFQPDQEVDFGQDRKMNRGVPFNRNAVQLLHVASFCAARVELGCKLRLPLGAATE